MLRHQYLFALRRGIRRTTGPDLWQRVWRATTALIIALLSVGSLLSAPVVQGQSGITAPADGSAVSGSVAIQGTATIDAFQKYDLHYKQEPSGDDSYIWFDGGTAQVTGGQLGVWQTDTLPPGTYSVRLRVVKNDGNYAEYYARNLSVNQSAPAPAEPSEPEAADEEETEAAEEIEEASTEPTPTPIPTATFTPAPQPTPVVGAVTQPEVGGAPPPTPTPDEVALGSQPGESAGETTEQLADFGDVGDSLAVIAEPNTAAVVEPGGSVTRELGEALSLNRLRSSFFNGVRFSAALFFGVVAIYAGKRLFDWAWSQFS
jgi:hypothetical protein